MLSGPDFLVVGAGRCGTTALAEGLRQHPDLFVTMPKEPHYFAFHGRTPAFRGPGDDVTVNRLSVTDTDAYLDLYAEGQQAVARGEASVSTFHYPDEAIPEVLRLSPDAKIIVLLREPVDRALSAFDYLSARGFEPCGSLLEAVAEEEQRVAADWHHLWHYTGMSAYAARLEAFQSAFGRERVGVWFYDDLKRDYRETLRQVMRFIGVDDTGAREVPLVNVSGTPRSRLVQAALHAATSNDRVRRAGKRFLSFRTREAVRRRLLRKNVVSDEVRRQLAPLFSDDLRRLRTLVDPERLPTWLAPSQP